MSDCVLVCVRVGIYVRNECVCMCKSLCMFVNACVCESVCECVLG